MKAISQTIQHTYSEIRLDKPTLIVLLAAYLNLAFLYLLSGRIALANLYSPVPPLSWLLLPLIVFGVIAIRKQWKLGILGLPIIFLTIPLLGLNLTQKYISTTTPAGPVITVFNWNTYYWEEENIDEFYEFLHGQNADVYQLQEYWYHNDPVAAKSRLHEEFPDHTIISEGQLVTITSLEVVQYKHSQIGEYLQVDVRADDAVISFFNIHTAIPLNPSSIVHPITFLKEVDYLFDLRSSQLSAIQNAIKESTNPVYISGDFNTSPSMHQLNWFRKNFFDASKVGGGVYPTSWNNKNLQFWLLDYNFVSYDMTPISYHSVDGGQFSDHDGQRVQIIY